LNPHLPSLCREITDCFELPDGADPYSYQEILKDGRGCTFTRYGFVQFDKGSHGQRIPGDIVEVCQKAGLRGVLKPVSEPAAFPARFATAMASPALRKRLIEACEAKADDLYWLPAVSAVEQDGFENLPVAYAIYYDTILQHGGGDDPDSFGSIRDRAKGDLQVFLKIRRKVLEHATDPDTRAVWRESVERVDELQKLLDHRCYLAGPLTVCGHAIAGLPISPLPQTAERP
jgi:chitosanase